MLWVVLLAVPSCPVAAQAPPEAPGEDLLIEWTACLQRTTRLQARLDSLVALEVLAWEQRRGAIARDAREEELRALVRGDALAASIREAAEELRRSDRACGELGGRLLEGVEEAIGRLPAGVGDARSDSLQALRRRLIAARGARRSTDLTLPRAAPGDTPDVLRLKALRARDLADLAAAWRADAEALRRTLEDQERLAREQRDLLGDLSFFDEGSGLDVVDLPTGDPPAGGVAIPDSSGIGGLLRTLLRDDRRRLEARSVPEALRMLEEWLESREANLRARAGRLDSLAVNWGREP